MSLVHDVGSYNAQVITNLLITKFTIYLIYYAW